MGKLGRNPFSSEPKVEVLKEQRAAQIPSKNLPLIQRRTAAPKNTIKNLVADLSSKAYLKSLKTLLRITT